MRYRFLLLAAGLLTYVGQSYASPTEQEYIRLLHESVAKYGGTTEEAMAHVIAQSDTSSGDDQFRLGTALMRVRHHFAAIEVLTRATQLSPQNAIAFANLGISYFTTGNCDGAVAAFGRSVDLDPSGPRAGSSFQQIGSCLIFKKDYLKAEQLCTKGRDLLPKDPAPRLCLGRALFLQGRYAEALASYASADALASRAYPPYASDAQSGVLASLAKLERLAEAQRILNLSSTSADAIERRAAAAVRDLELNKKPQW